MNEEVNILKASEEIKNASEEELRAIIEKWYEGTRTAGMHLGAKMISAAIFDVIQANLSKAKPSLRDHERCIKDIRKIIDVQLTRRNDSKEAEAISNDGTTE